MKTTKFVSLLLMLVLIINLAACNTSAAPELPTDEQATADAKEYISAFIDPNAEIVSVVPVWNVDDNDQAVATCTVTMDSELAGGVCVLTMTYDKSGKDWALSNCQADVSDAPTQVDGVYTTEDADDLAAATADMFAGIQTDYDVDIPEFDVDKPREYPESVNGVSTIADIENIYKFTLDGESYSLPFSVKELINRGWHSSDLNGTLDAMSGTTMVLYKGDVSISLMLANLTDSSADIQESTVYEITVSDTDCQFKTAHGLSLGDNSDRVTDLYGSETYSSSDTGNEYRYLKQLGLTDELDAIWSDSTQDDCLHLQWDEDGKVDYIQMHFIYR